MRYFNISFNKKLTKQRKKMIKKVKETSIKLSLIAAIAVAPLSLQAASASGVIDGSSESISALIENPNVEQQINRVNVGIAFVRVNTVILGEMPISGDSTWVDELTKPMTSDMFVKIRKSPAVMNDPYFATAPITNALLGRKSLALSPLNARLYLILNTIYKNTIPDIYGLPSFDNMATFTNFPPKNHGKKVEKIEVNAAKFEKFPNVELATISLAPKKYQEKLMDAKNEYAKDKLLVAKTKGAIESAKAWLDEDDNSNSPKRPKYKKIVEIKNAELDKQGEALNTADETYTKLVKEAALEIESFIPDDFMTREVPLAKKLEKLLDLVDNNTIGAESMFAAATAHLIKNGVGTLDKELQALTTAQALTTLVGNQKEFIDERLARFGKGALMLLPNIAVGTYYAIKQSNEAGRYQIIVNKVLEIAETQAAADKKAKEIKSK